jgi:hypothetical protein
MRAMRVERLDHVGIADVSPKNGRRRVRFRACTGPPAHAHRERDDRRTVRRPLADSAVQASKELRQTERAEGCGGERRAAPPAETRAR